MKKRIFAVILSFCIGLISFATFGGTAVAADTYLAKAVLGYSNTLENITIANDSNQINSVVFNKGGRMGYTSSIASGKYFLPFNIDDSVLYNAPLYTPVDITVEYFDEIDLVNEKIGFFGLQYHIHSERANADSFTNDNTLWGGEGMCVQLGGTNTWKSVTFHIEDGAFANGLGTSGNKYDFRLAVWDPIRGYSPTDVVIGSVTVSASEFSSLVNCGYIGSNNIGNIFAANDPITFTQNVENKQNEAVISKYTWEITDESGRKVGDTYEGEDELGAMGTGTASATRSITVPNPQTYGIYTIHVTEENYAKAAPDEKYFESYTEEFSVCISLDQGDADPNFGFNQTVVTGKGDSLTAGTLMQNAGATWNRESVMWVGVEDSEGELNIADKDMSKVRRLTNDGDGGLKLVCVLTGRHPLHGGESNPSTSAEIAAFARFAGYCAEHLYPYVDHFEIWNEWNSSNFNPTGKTPETYAALLKASYTAIKEANPNAVVIGCDTAGAGDESRQWIGRVLTELKRLDQADGNTGKLYMDALSVHCYDYTAADGFLETQFIQNAEALKTLLDEKGYGDLPLWLTEVGFSTYDNPTVDFFVDGCTKEVQLNSLVLMSAINKAYGLYDKTIEYCFHDNGDQSYISDNWGVLNCWTRDYKPAVNHPESKLQPSGAKPSYLGIAAMNYFTGGNAVYRDMQKNDRCYAVRFHNNNLNKDVILAINGGISNNQTQEFDLGCESVDIYDKYGNLKEQMSSETGVYSINTYSDPIYIVGNIENSEVHHEGILVNASVDRETNIVTITGNTSEPNDSVTVMVLTDGPAITAYDPTRVVYMEQTTADANGDFSVEYEVDSLTGAYQIYVNSIEKKAVVVKDLVFSYTTPKLSVTQNGEAVTDITQLSAGDRPVVTLTGYETTTETAPRIMIAQYQDGVMIDVKKVTASGNFTALGSEFTTDFTVATGADCVKIMYWDLGSMSPLAPNYVID